MARRYTALAVDTAIIALAIAFGAAMARHAANETIGDLIGKGVLLCAILHDPLLVSRFGCTVGHRLLHMRVVPDVGRRLSFPRALLRMLVKTTLGFVSFFFVPLTKRRQALHDILTRSTVRLHGVAILPPDEQPNVQGSADRPASLVRRVLVVMAYIAVAFMIMAWAIGHYGSSECLNLRQCTSAEETVHHYIELAFLASMGLIIYLGLRSRLPGARRPKGSLPAVPVTAEPQEPGPWARWRRKTWSGFWSGLGWFVIWYLSLYAAGILAWFVLGATEDARPGLAGTTQWFGEGDVSSISHVLLLMATVTIISFAVRRRRRQPMAAFLGFRRVKGRDIAFWLAAAFAVACAYALCDKVFSRPVAPEWAREMVEMLASARMPWLFFLAVVLLGPISEELLYRGYIVRVWADSRIGAIRGTLLLSVMWAATHLQYDLYEVVWIFILGVLLCASRLMARSIYPALAIHVAWNLLSLLAIVHRFGGRHY